MKKIMLTLSSLSIIGSSPISSMCVVGCNEKVIVGQSYIPDLMDLFAKITYPNQDPNEKYPTIISSDYSLPQTLSKIDDQFFVNILNDNPDLKKQIPNLFVINDINNLVLNNGAPVTSEFIDDDLSSTLTDILKLWLESKVVTIKLDYATDSKFGFNYKNSDKLTEKQFIDTFLKYANDNDNDNDSMNDNWLGYGAEKLTSAIQIYQLMLDYWIHYTYDRTDISNARLTIFHGIVKGNYKKFSVYLTQSSYYLKGKQK